MKELKLTFQKAGFALICLVFSFAVLAQGSENDVYRLPDNHSFVHPGILNIQEEYDFIKQQVQQGKEPWATAYYRLQRESEASLDFIPVAYDTVYCDVDNPDHDPTSKLAETHSAHAAYAHALQWIIEGNEANAQKAIEIMNLWASTLKAHVGFNKDLRVAWLAPVFARAGEIIRATYPSWSQAEQDQFARLLHDVYLPHVEYGRPQTAGNWELSFIEATLSIAVFTEDIEIFNRGISMLVPRIKNYFYLKSDGPLPIAPEPRPDFTYPNWMLNKLESFQTEEGIRDYWYMNPGDNFYDGQCQETNRDLLHVQMGLAACINSMEIVLSQGIDLFTPNAERITRAMEFNGQFLLGAEIPPDLDGGQLKWTDKREQAWENAFNRFHNWLGYEMPNSELIVNQHRVNPPNKKLHMCFETLTHADLPFLKEIIKEENGSIILNPDADSYVFLNPNNSNHADTNFGDANKIWVTAKSDGRTQESYLRFDISTVTDVGTATLKLFTVDHPSSGNFVVYKCSDNSWDESTITWNNKPELGDSVAVFNPETAEEWAEADVTKYVKENLENEKITFVVATKNSEPFTSFYSKENENNSPVLEITSGSVSTSISKKFKKDFNLRIYPNPSYDGKFTLELQSDFKKVSFRIFNMAGQMIYSSIVKKPISFIDLDENKGLNIIHVTADGKDFRKKILVF